MIKKEFYKKIESNPSFAILENEVLEFWKEKEVFLKSITNRSDNNSFVFYDGPPFANGLPHYGHLLTGFIKDIVARYQTMSGKKVERRFGWDCHGLPAELGAEKELGISGRLDILKIGIDKFNDTCRNSVMRYTKEWEDYVTRQARWVDFDNDYKTMNPEFMESVIWAFKELYNKGLIYQAMRVMPYSWACETPLSNFETRLDNSYRERADKAITVSFLLKNKPLAMNNVKINCQEYRILAWTTTPWTLPSNLALAVNENIDYSFVIKDEICYILSVSSMKKYEKEFDIKSDIKFKGSELIGCEYFPILPYFSNHKNSFRILSGEFVTDVDGTGIVHMAPGFGEDDQILCEKNNIKLVCPVDSRGCFTNEVADYQNMLVFDANDEIIKKLKQNGSWIKTEQYIHNYPHCWRTDTPLIYKAVPSWYVKVTEFRERMVQLNQQINWIPSHIKDGLFGKWLENARDWSISRNRFWGTPIPVWISDNPKYPRIDVYGSIAELEKDFNVKIDNLHKPFIDNLIRPNPDDPTGNSMMKRVEDVFDCWFESGSMPYAQLHYPFENREKFEKNSPADFIVEYTAQTRGWFYTLMVLSTALFDRPPFLNCICHGVILDINGQKLSKRLQNYADPKDLFEKYGSDSLRFLMASSVVMRGQELLIDKDGNMVKDVLRLTIKPLWNAYNFFTLYANSDGIKAEYDFTSSNIMDRYILAKLIDLSCKIKLYMDQYDTPSACNDINNFLDILNNWYIRRNRQRFWKEEKDLDKQEAYNSLYTVLYILCKISAPLLPLITEQIYQGLLSKYEFSVENSVHLTDYPILEHIHDKEHILINEMDRVRDICSAALSVRNAENIRTRQPLSDMYVIGSNIEHLRKYMDLIKDEVNIKNLYFSSDITDKANLKLKINFPVLGKRLPDKIKQIIQSSKNGDWKIMLDGKLNIAAEIIDNTEYEILLEPIDKKNTCLLSTKDAFICLNLEITSELLTEGMVRDLTRMIQQSRKDLDLYVSDRIFLIIDCEEHLQSSLSKFKSYISEQTLSEIIFEHIDSNFAGKENVNIFMLENYKIKYKIIKK